MRWIFILMILIIGCQPIEKPMEEPDQTSEEQVDKGPMEPQVEITEESCQSLPTDQIEMCLVRAAYEAGDITLCEDMVDEFYKDRCYLGVSEKTGDPTICELIEGSDRDRCLTSHSG